MITVLCLAAPAAGGTAAPPQNGDHRLEAGEMLRPGQSVTSSSGRVRLQLRSDGDLVVLRDGAVVWSAGTAGTSAERAIMQHDGVLSVYGRPAHGSAPVWQSRQGRFPGAILSVRDEGGMVISKRGGPIIWSAALPAPEVGLDGVQHIVYGRGDQMVWLVDTDGVLFDSYLVSGRATWPRPGRYEVLSKSLRSTSLSGHLSMEHMVRFVQPVGLAATGFHSIPVNWNGTPIQSEEELGLFRSLGCVRQSNVKAEQLYNWAPLGTPVVVIA